MSTHFNERKATALAALMLRERGGEMKHIHLIKLMYLVEREAFRRWGHSVTGDKFVSMANGPVLSKVLNLINGVFPKSFWSRKIQKVPDHNVRLVETVESTPLSEAEESLGLEIVRKFGGVDRWDLCALTHKFPEYKETDEEVRRHPISHKELLQHTGKSEEDARRISEYHAAVARDKDLLSV